MTMVTCAHRQKTLCIDTLLDKIYVVLVQPYAYCRSAKRLCLPVVHPRYPLNVSSCSNSLLVSLSTGTPPPRRSRGGQTHSRPPMARTGAREERYPHAAIPERCLRAQRQKRGQGTQARWIGSASSSCCAATTQHPASRAKAARPEDHPHQEAVTQN
jgi:hypothetical protein